MSQNRRRFLGSAAIAAGLLGLAGCSTSGQPSGQSSGAPSSGAKTAITYDTVGNDSLIAAERKIVSAYEQANPDVTVNVQAGNFSDYDTKMTTAFRSG